MTQLKSRCHVNKHRDSGQPVWLIGVGFSKETRNLAAFEVKRA